MAEFEGSFKLWEENGINLSIKPIGMNEFKLEEYHMSKNGRWRLLGDLCIQFRMEKLKDE